ncbi:MAG: glycoside hydrolase family 92 protein [Prevotellaceae bacterium]|jgi:predicted alpha-1,2-mannosidase|nr:glycoside hydrolase family 92 protein [Prevotellaceae bacterium]
MKNIFFLLSIVVYLPFTGNAQTSPANKVNPLTGSQWNTGDNTANYYPIVGLFFGMNYWTAQTTSDNEDKIVYNYAASKISGFRQTQQTSSKYEDYGAFALMPMSDTLITDCNKRTASFEHYNEKAYPYYYRVRFDNGIVSEITPTERAAIMRFKYPYGGKSYLLLDVIKGKSKVEIIPVERKIVGYCTNPNGELPENFAKYFVIKLLRQFNDYGTWHKNTIAQGQLTAEGDAVGAWIMLNLNANEIVTVEVTSSFISIEQAEQNLAKELNYKTFETAKQEAQNRWETILKRIAIEGGTDDEQQLFYTCMYRALLFPRIQHEFDPSGNPVHYSFYDGKLYNRPMYNNNVLNGGYKAVKTLFDLLLPGLYQDVYDSYLNAINEGKKNDTNSVHSQLCALAFANSTNVYEQAYRQAYINKSQGMQKNIRSLLTGFTNSPSFKLSEESASWCIFSSIGLYPADSVFILGSPLFDKTTITFPDRKTFVISAEDNSPENVYVEKVFFNSNSTDYTKLHIPYNEIINSDGTIHFIMSPAADTTLTREAPI